MAVSSFDGLIRDAWREFDVAWLIFNEFSDATPQVEVHIRESSALLHRAAMDPSAPVQFQDAWKLAAPQLENRETIIAHAAARARLRVVHELLRVAAKSRQGLATQFWKIARYLLMAALIGLALMFLKLIGDKAYAKFFPVKEMQSGDIKVSMSTQSWGNLGIDKSVEGYPLRIGGDAFRSGFGTHANSEIRVHWDKVADTLKGGCGVDDRAGSSGSVVCSIELDDKVVASSPILRKGDVAWRFDVPLDGATEAVLVVGDGENGIESDHADWVDLKVE